jgi:superfamily I DNA and/or RNA helicase
VEAGHRRCEDALQVLAAASAPFQESLFDSARPTNTLRHLVNVFGERRAVRLHALPVREQLLRVRERSARLSRFRALCDKGIAERKKALLNKEREAVAGAGLVLSTLTNAYFSPLMQAQRFDAVIVEEASMAVLPALFYAACLGERKTVIVGDPCQLPSIVQSDEEYVRRVMGRNIFDVAVADPGSSPLVTMLDVQYRMHPVIGGLVSDLFYFGRLKHGGDMAAREGIAALDPHAGAPLVVVDTAGRTTCQQGTAGQSRFNVKTAELSVELAVRAAGSGAESVAIITPYVDQARAIRALLKNYGQATARIECSTVHRFQGQERDVVILDTVDADPMKPGVLLSEQGPRSSAQNLINVAISRARGKLIVVADVGYFEQRAPASVVAKMITRAMGLGRRESVAWA